MRGIILRDAVKMFGFKIGLSFWFRWSFVDPIEMFIWLNITHKPYCLWAGFHCNKKDCNHKHLFTKKEILEHWEKRIKESKKVEGSKDGICVYCGEEKGTEIIDDPNWDNLGKWLVCKTCNDVIELQRELTFPLTSIERQQEINDRLLEISKSTGKKIMIAEIKKDSGFSSTVYG